VKLNQLGISEPKIMKSQLGRRCAWRLEEWLDGTWLMFTT